MLLNVACCMLAIAAGPDEFASPPPGPLYQLQRLQTQDRGQFIEDAEATSKAPAMTAPAVSDSLTPSTLTPPVPTSPDRPASPRVLRACARIAPGELIRMHGTFGRFQGFATSVGPRGMEGLRSDPSRRRHFRDPAPPGRISWEQIDYVERRETSFARGALSSGLGLFATVGLFSYLLGGLAAGAGGEVDPLHFALVAGATAGGIGVVLGGAIGGHVPSWHRVYERP